MKRIATTIFCAQFALGTLFPQAPAAAPPAAQQAPPPQQTASPAPVMTGSLNLTRASLVEVVDVLCRQLKINYMIDPKVTGSVSLSTYGETRSMDARELLNMILRINGFTMVKVGDIYRIVPMADALRLPLPMTKDPSAMTEDESTVLSLIFLKYATAPEVGKLVEPFIGAGASVTVYQPANLIFLMDSRRNARRVMELISMFDSDMLANQRVKIYNLKNGSPDDVSKELESILKSISLSEKTSHIRFLPVERLNILIAVAPNPGVFEEIDKWVEKLDTEVKVSSNGLGNYIYRVKYSRAEILAGSITMLYGGYPMFGGMGGMGGFGGMGGYGMGGMGGGYGMGGYGMGGMGGGYGMGGMGGYGMGGGYGNYAMGTGGYQQASAGFPGMGVAGFLQPGQSAFNQGGAAVSGAGVGQTSADQSGSYMSGMGMMGGRIPRIIPNQIDNTLLIQCTPQEWSQIEKLLKDLDIPPRQVLVDAKIFEVSLTGAFASGVAAYFQKRSNSERNLLGTLNAGVTNLSMGMLVGQSRELLAFLQLAENQSRTKVISAPSVIATDSVGASIMVGQDVPTLSSQGVAGGVQSGGSSVFANQIANRSAGVQLSVNARVTPSGVVTMTISQEVSAPQAPAAGAIQSPSFSRRNVQTQVTVQDGDTIAIGGIITESNTSSSAGIPGLHKLPIVGSVFGSRSYSKERSELIIFMTPRVIYDTNQVVEASDELRNKLRRLQKVIRQNE